TAIQKDGLHPLPGAAAPRAARPAVALAGAAPVGPPRARRAAPARARPGRGRARAAPGAPAGGAPGPGARHPRPAAVRARGAPGAVAAPTAGLHFDDSLFARLDARGVERAFLTLHVGAGTFSPVRTEQIEAHRLHPEWVSVSAELCERIARTRAAGRRVVAVG